jgi:hypothetical protein
VGKDSGPRPDKDSVVDAGHPATHTHVRDFPSCSSPDSNLELISEAPPSRAEPPDNFRRANLLRGLL